MLQLCCFLLCPDPGASAGWAASLAFPGMMSSLLISARCGTAWLGRGGRTSCRGVPGWALLLWLCDKAPLVHRWPDAAGCSCCPQSRWAPRAGFSCLNQPAWEQLAIPASPLLLLQHWLKIIVVYTLDRFKHLSVKMEGISSLME